ncbi:MAG: HAMP domain-containing protein, partial [Zoogloea sp.]|uniref:HAMP domain-containing protein n=1 Tax=Zoogloea sp. TaxID=49181 RepID=UPI003F3DDBEB
MSTTSFFLSPAKSLISHFRFGQKFFLVGLICCIPIVVLLFASYQKLSADLAFAEKERLGLKLIQPAREFIELAQIHRGKSQLAIAGKKEVLPQLKTIEEKAAIVLQKWGQAQAEGKELNTSEQFNQIKAKWQETQSKALDEGAEASFAQHSELVESALAYIGLVADNSNLTLDPDLDSYYVMDALTSKVTNVAELSGKLRAKSSYLATKGVVSVDDRVQVAVLMRLLGDAVTGLNDGLNKASKANASVEAQLSAPLKQLMTQQGAFLVLVNESVMQGKANADGERLFAEGTKLVDSAYGLFDLALPVLDQLLGSRCDHLRNELRKDFVVSGFCILLALYFFLALRSAITEQIDDIREGTGRIANGDFDRQIVVASRDELGDVARLLDQVRVKLNASISAERKAAEENLRIKIALDNVSTGVMIADPERRIVYVNPAVKRVLREAESDIRLLVPSFSAEALLGQSIDQFHKNPAHQARMLATFTATHVANLLVGARHLQVTASPVLSGSGERLGSVAEWKDRTGEVLVQREVEELVQAAAAGDFSKRLKAEG